jgi:Holliday junction resolvase RusA-like endonuclease
VIQIILSGAPVSAGRPRFRNIQTTAGASFASTYTPAKTRNYQRDLRFRAQEEMTRLGLPPLAGALSVQMDVWLPIPKSLSTKKKAMAGSGMLRPMTRPDLDNYIKQLDALNGVCWLDDSQIVSITAQKRFSASPCVVINIEAFGVEA